VVCERVAVKLFASMCVIQLSSPSPSLQTSSTMRMVQTSTRRTREPCSHSGGSSLTERVRWLSPLSAGILSTQTSLLWDMAPVSASIYLSVHHVLAYTYQCTTCVHFMSTFSVCILGTFKLCVEVTTCYNYCGVYCSLRRQYSQAAFPTSNFVTSDCKTRSQIGDGSSLTVIHCYV